jgi:hypothetical protein
MQSSLTKRALQETLKVASRATQSNMKYILFSQPAVQKTSASLSLSSAILRNFSSEENVQFEKVTSYESLISRICNASNINDLLNIMNQNISLYKNEHIVLTLRVLARLTKGTNPSQIDALNKDERYKALTVKAQENLEEFNEYEILDFLFWLRRFKTARLPTHVNEESLDKLYNKIKDFVKSKSFNFRNLVNLYYDLSCLNRNTDDIAAEILNELKADFKLLTPFTIVQILQASSRKKGLASPHEYLVADYVQRNLASMLPEFDSDQKCVVFKYLSTLEMHINPPKYKVPNILYKLRVELKDILDQLSELGVINILEAYGELPKEFPSDLLDEIKEMVIVTIQHNSENIKSFFLIDFLDRILNLSRGRKPTEDKVIIIYEEIAKRISSDEFTSRFKTIEKLLSIYEKAGIQYEPILDKIVQRLSEFQGTFFSGPILRSLNRNGKDISALIDKYLESNDIKTINPTQRFQLFSILSEIKNTDKYKPLIDEIKATLLENPEYLAKFVTSSDLAYNKNFEEVYEAIIQHSQQNKASLSDFNLFRNMFFTTVNRNNRNLWTQWAKDNLTDFDKTKTNRLIDVFFSLDKISVERFLLFSTIIERIPNEYISFKKLISYLKENKEFLYEANRMESRFQKFLVKILRLMDTNPKDVRLPAIYSFIKRFETLGLRSPIVPLIAKKAFELAKASNANINLGLDINFSLYLMDQNLLRLEYAQQLYTRLSSLDTDVHVSSKVLAYILNRTPRSQKEGDEIRADVNKKLETLHQGLNETGARTVLVTLASILSFPPEFLESNKDLYIKSIKSFLNFGNQSLYSNILNAIRPAYAQRNYDFYAPIIRELIVNYNNFNRRMSPPEIVRTLSQFSEFNTKNPTIYNHILADIGRIFNTLRNDELAEVVASFARIRVKQTDLFDKILSKIANHPHSFTGSVKEIAGGFYRVGFNSPQAKAVIAEIIDKISNPANVLELAYYLSILNVENEAQLFEKLLSQVNAEKLLKNKRISKNALLGLEEYLRIVHKDKPELAETVRKVLPDFEQDKADSLKKTQAIYSKSKKIIGDYLSIMKVNSQTDFSIDGHNIDLYIPEKKTIIKIFSYGDVNFDRISLTGRASQEKRIYESFQGYNTIFINFVEFKSIPENMNKINHLIALGVENKNTEGTYDFSRVTDTQEVKEEELSGEEVEKDDVISEDAIVEEVEEAAKVQN